MDIQQNFNLKAYNTFGLDVSTTYFAEFHSIEEIAHLLKEFSNTRKLVLGGGSTILFTADFEGIVLKNEIKGIEIISRDDEHIRLKVGAGENWHQFVLYCIENNYAGIENLSLIPGSVGAAPMQNIGAYGVEVKEVIESVEAYHIQSGEIHTFVNQECEFGYRESIFKHKVKGEYIISSVIFRWNKKPNFNISYGAIEETLKEQGIQNLSIKAISDAVIHIRSSKLPNPSEIGNAGSFFKNPEIPLAQFEQLKTKFPDIANYPLPDNQVKIPAGWLIEKAGWKGKKLGNIGVHDKQALVLVNFGGGKGQEIKALSEEIQNSVFEKFGIGIQAEVNVV